ncbi:MAG: hypothetical protein H0U36_10090 [Nocardioidaceae bacterium]|nr:hypothetical protein [Nocardioidaceae bacterium]
MDQPRHRTSFVFATRRSWAPGRRGRWAAVALVVTLAVATVVAVGAGRPRDTVLGGGATTSLWQASERPAPSAYPKQSVPMRREARWVSVVSGLDSVRERAWRTGRPALLRTVYVEGSAPLERDQHMLRAYAERGLRVSGASLELERIRVVARQPGVVRLVLVDELDRLVARTRSGATRQLPDDQPSRHLLELRREAGGWQIAAVWAQ